MEIVAPSSTYPAIAVILTDAARHIQWVNDDFTRITGYTLSEVAGRKPSILQGVNTEVEVVMRMRRQLSAAKPLPFREDITNYRKNGEEYKCRLVIHPVFDDGGRLTNFIAFEVDADELGDTHAISLMQFNADVQYLEPLLNHEELDIYTKLIKVIELEKAYLDPNLRVATLAQRLGRNSQELSAIVKKQTGDTLTELINRYRVEAFKLKITDGSYHYLTNIAIANACGFNTKSTFYKAFKEVMGITPKEYIKQKEQGK